MEGFFPLRECPQNENFKKGDLLVVFGEVFDKGYINGLIKEAEDAGMTVIYGTVGRRDENGNLRKLTDQEVKDKNQPNLINIPLEAGFDLEKDTATNQSPCDQLAGLKRDNWDQVKLDWDSINTSWDQGKARFRKNTKAFLQEVEKYVTSETSVVFAHTMAGGIPRAKILMPLLNRVFKGHGPRFLSSEVFWESEIGKLCSLSFDEVTANTFQVLIEETEGIRTKANHTAYTAYGYHGCEALVKNEYKWQSYAPYLQGWAKKKLENIANEAFSKNIHAQVFNSPEILTNSSSVFMGVEVCLYPLLSAINHESNNQDFDIIRRCKELLKDPKDLETVHTFTQQYLTSSQDKMNEAWKKWPQHNEPDQMGAMREASNYLVSLHKDPKSLMTLPLSEVVFQATGKAMLGASSNPTKPVWWVGHDLVAKTYCSEK